MNLPMSGTWIPRQGALRGVGSNFSFLYLIFNVLNTCRKKSDARFSFHNSFIGFSGEALEAINFKREYLELESLVIDCIVVSVVLNFQMMQRSVLNAEQAQD
jgi:hypothetical protein